MLGEHENVNIAVALLGIDRRQRTYAALAHDTACLQQMAAVLSKRSAGAARESMVGLVEETQLYAVSMEELAVQISVHSPPLSHVASSLYKGFTKLFKRAMEHEKARLEKEREAHAATRHKLAQSLQEAKDWKEEATKNENKLSVLRYSYDEADRALSHAQTMYHQARTQAKRMRKVLDGYVNAAGDSVGGRADNVHLKRLQEQVAGVDAAAAEAEGVSDEVGQAVDNLNLMVRALSMRPERGPPVDDSTQTEAEAEEVAEVEVKKKVRPRRPGAGGLGVGAGRRRRRRGAPRCLRPRMYPTGRVADVGSSCGGGSHGDDSQSPRQRRLCAPRCARFRASRGRCVAAGVMTGVTAGVAAGSLLGSWLAHCWGHDRVRWGHGGVTIGVMAGGTSCRAWCHSRCSGWCYQLEHLVAVPRSVPHDYTL